MADTWPEKIWLMGSLKPMRFEANVDDCIVTEGEVPTTLNGGFYRVGGTWKRPSRQGITGPFTLDGMVQGLIFREGRVDFRNRWIRTPKYQAEERAGRALFDWTDGKFDDWRGFGWGEVIRNELTHGVPQGTNNVNVVPFAGQLLALGEQGSPPVAIDPISLNTAGIVPWSTRLSRGMHEPACFGDAAFTAHPKWDPQTGELFGWTYTDAKPYTTLHWVKPDGTVRSRELWDAPYAALTHDMWLTQNYVVLPFQPLIVGTAHIEEDKAFYEWKPELPIVLAVIRRDDFDAPIRWLDTGLEPQYVLHTMSANHDGDRLILDAPLYEGPPFPSEKSTASGSDYVPMPTARLGRWTIELSTGTVRSEHVDDRACEFPKVDERFYGQPYTKGFLVAGAELWSLDTLVCRDIPSGKEQSYRIQRDSPVSVFEPTFAPRHEGAPEGDGYLILPVSRFMENLSEFLIFDTEDVGAGPVARIELPFQIGWTPHGHWMDFTSGELARSAPASRDATTFAATELTERGGIPLSEFA
jgi:carotenoid cleavage dioxygenase